MTTAISTFSGVQRTSFADRDAARSDQVPTYKAKVGAIDRISLVSDRKGPPALVVARVHAHFSEDKAKKGLGYVLCKSTFKKQGDMEVPETVATCCRLMGDARKRCAALVIKYNADPKNGQPTKPVGFQALVWLFPPDKFENLFTIHEEFADKDEEGNITNSGLNKVDLLISCEDELYQKIKIVPSPTCVQNHPTFVAEYGQTLLDWEKNIGPRLDRVVAREVSDEMIVAAMTGQGAGVAAANVAPMQAPKEIDDLFK